MSAVQKRLVKRPATKSEEDVTNPEEVDAGVVDKCRYNVIRVGEQGRRTVHCHRDTRAEAESAMKGLVGKGYIIPPSENKVKEKPEKEPGGNGVWNEMAEGKSVPSSLLSLSSVTDRVLDRFRELKGRLSPVLKSVPEEDDDSDDEFGLGDCDVSRGVNQEANKLSHLCREMRDLIDQLEV